MKDLAKLARLDAIAQAELCARGELTPAELVHECRERLAALEPLLRSVVAVTPAPAAPSAGPLRGVPFLMKDALPWPDLRWTLGARLFGERVTQQQTEYGRRLVEAGLVCVGKSAMSEFGLLASTETLLAGATHNPWSLAHSPMGSSGGSAAAVAAGLVPIAHANDGGGSIRVPASACGVFGFKPSRGRTVVANRSGSDFVEMTSDHCISRSVRDSALFLSLTEDRTRAEPVGFVREPLTRKLRIGAWSETMSGEEADPAVLIAFRETVELLSELGHTVQYIAAPRFDMVSLAGSFYLVAAAAIANVVDTIDRTRALPVQFEELEPFTWSLLELLAARGPAAVPEARQSFAAAVQSYRDATRDFDVVLTPTLATEPTLLGQLSPILPAESLLQRSSRVLAYTPIQNIAGAPAMSVPLHWSKSGLPIGSHFAAAPGRDALLLALAYQLERARPWHERWPPYSIPSLCGAAREPST